MGNAGRIYVNLFCPGRRFRAASRICITLFFILLTSTGFASTLRINPFGSSDLANAQSGANSSTSNQTSLQPANVGASPLPDLSLPQTVVSSIGNLTSLGGVIQDSAENLTLYTPSTAMRLLGGASPYDELLGPGDRVVNGPLSWTVEANDSGLWIPLKPQSNNFTLLGRNNLGTIVQRTMPVNNGSLAGVLMVTYFATPAGPLKWDLNFTTETAGQYRILYDWENLTGENTVSPVGAQFFTKLPFASYTFSWNDIPSSYSPTPNLAQDQFELIVSLGTVKAGSKIVVDPSIVANNVGPNGTADTFQRHVFYDPTYGNYWVFYNNQTHQGPGFSYSYSRDGVNWYQQKTLPSGWPSCQFCFEENATILELGNSVVLAKGEFDLWYPGCRCSTSLVSQLIYSVGTFTQSGISWSNTSGSQPAFQQTCPPSSGECTLAIRDVSATVSSTGQLAFSFNELYNIGVPEQCSSNLFVLYGSGSPLNLGSDTSCNNPDSSSQTDSGADVLRSVVVPSDLQGGVTVVYQNYTLTGSRWNKQLSSIWFKGSTTGSKQLLDGNVYDTGEFSAVSDSHYTIHILYRSNIDGNTTYLDLSSSQTSSSWTHSSNIFGLQVSYPTITVDSSTNDLYAFAVYGSSIIMKEKGSNWNDSSPAFPITGRPNSPAFLGSDFSSASLAGSSQLELAWTEGSPCISTCTIVFASIPIQTVWSPYADPRDPWDGNGLAPYGQYFTNLDESVSPSSGLLDVIQTDLSVPGRGLSLTLTRVYTEPGAFLNGQPYGFEQYPWAPMGPGWQLNFPWMNDTSHPLFVHLWNGEGYRIPSSFWSGASGAFENHQGENFRMIRNSTGIYLYNSQGDAYVFDSTKLNHLAEIVDPYGNAIQFSYGGNLLVSISDTTGALQRLFSFCYSFNPTLLIGVYMGFWPGNCNVGTVVFKYSGTNLVQAFDPAGRVTNYTYNSFANSPVAPWLLSRITYPTGWYTNYTYQPSVLGTQASSYRVTRQYTGTGTVSSSRIREFDFAYTNGPGDQVNNSTVITYNGTSSIPVRYESYAFSFAGVAWNITNSIHSFVSGEEQRFGVHGEVPREIVLVSPTQGYTNFYRYDLWGNMVYRDQSVNPSSNSYFESFNAYYNDGLPPGFRAFQETFSEDGGNATDNFWAGNAGDWNVQNGLYNGTYVNGSLVNTFSWSNFSSPNYSVQARVYLARQINSTAQAGIFVHYPGTGNEKWSLYLYDQTGFPSVAYLQDDGTAYSTSITCSLANLVNKWYTFNITVQSNTVNGWLKQDGQSTCNVSYTFPSFSPVSHSTGFGLVTGGFSALYDNITITTVSPTLTTTGFSNSFFQNGAPNPNIHNALAGTAELQNGTGSAPIETYNSYYSQGGLNQTKQLYSPTSGTVWLTSRRTYDTYGNPYQIIDPRGNTTTFTYSSSYDHAYLTRETTTVVPGNVSATTSYSYNFTTGTQSSIVDPNGNNITSKYDVLDRLTKVTYSTGDYTSYSYNDALNYVDITNENGWHTREIYDGLGRFKTTESFLNNAPYANQTSTYNWQNRQSSATDPLNDITYIQYDPLGRLVNTTYPNGTHTIQTYNDTGSAIITTNQNGNLSCRIYDRLGRLLSVIEVSTASCHPLSLAGNTYVTDYSYDEAGNLLQLTNANLQSTSYKYDNLNRLVSITYPDHTVESYNYDNNGNLVSKVDRKNIGTTYSYDSLNRPTSIRYPNSPGAGDNYTYDMNGNILALQSQNGTVFYSYDSRNRVLSETYAVNPPPADFRISSGSSTVWAAQGSSGSASVSLQANSGFAAIITFSTSGLPSGATPIFIPGSVSLSPNQYSSISFNIATTTGVALGSYTVTLTARSGTQTHSLTFTLRVIASTISYKYTSVQNGINGTIHLNLTVNTFTSQTVTGQIKRTALNSTTLVKLYNDTISPSLTFSTTGTAVFVAEMSTSPFWTSFDCSLTLTQSNGNPACGFNRTPDIDHSGIVDISDSTFVSSKFNCQQGQSCYDPRADLDADGSISVVDVNDEDFAFNSQVLLPGDYTISADPPGSVTAGSQWTPEIYLTGINGFNATITFSISVPSVTGLSAFMTPPSIFLGSTNDSFLIVSTTTFTPAGTYNITVTGGTPGHSHPVILSLQVNATLSCPAKSSITNPSGGSYTYVVGYCYRGEVLDSQIYPDGNVVGYTYDGLGRTLTVTGPGSSAPYASFQYNQNNQVSNANLGNGLTYTSSYDKLSRPSVIRVANYTGPNPLYLAYNYTAAGAVSSVTGTVNGQTVNEQYTYDPLQRLTNSTVTNDGSTTTSWYQYDPLGNRLVQNINGTRTTYTYNNANELTKACIAPSGNSCSTNSTYSYDADGDLLKQNVTSTNTHWTYTWNPSGQLTKVVNAAGAQGQYAYDGNGRRTKSIEGSTTTFYGYSGTSVLFQNVQGASPTDFIFANGMEIAKLVSGNTVSYYHTDALGSTRLVTDSNRHTVFSDGYQPYGQDNGRPTGTETYKFTGKPVSQTTGLYYYGARWYDPSIGRFVSQDSNAGYLSDPQSLNRYVYTENAPTSYTDPTGDDPISFLFGLAIGAGIGYGWCVASGGGWLSSQCGWAALGGAAQGGLAGLTDGGSLLLEGGLDAGAGAACEVECSALSNDLSTTATTDSSDVTVSAGSGASTITSVTSDTSTITPITTESTTPITVGTGGLPDDALVVRGGLNTVDSLDANLRDTGSISARSHPGATIEQLSEGIPNKRIGLTTVGSIRGIGGDVISTPTDDIPFHATIVLGPGGIQELSALFKIMPNPRWEGP